MQLRQTKLSRFFRKKGDDKSDSDGMPDDMCVYDHSNQRQKYSTPMYWTRVLLVDAAAIDTIEVKDVEADIIADKTMQQIRRSAVRETGTLIFDPEEFKHRQQPLTIANYQLTPAQLLKFGKQATRIMRIISRSVRPHDEDNKLEPSEGMSDLQLQVANHKSRPRELYRDDFTEKLSPGNPRGKKRSLRQLSAETRLAIVTMASKRGWTQQEVADRFGVKAQVVKDLMKNLGK